MASNPKLRNLIATITYLMDLGRITRAAREMAAKGVSAETMKQAILDSGTPLLPEVVVILENAEKEARGNK